MEHHTICDRKFPTLCEACMVESEVAAQKVIAVTREEFASAASRLLGKSRYTQLVASGYNPADLCSEIARREFIRRTDGTEAKRHLADLATVRQIAINLWSGDGCLGFADYPALKEKPFREVE